MKWTTIRKMERLGLPEISKLTPAQIKNIEKKGCPINCPWYDRSCDDCLTYEWIMREIRWFFYDYDSESD